MAEPLTPPSEPHLRRAFRRQGGMHRARTTAIGLSLAIPLALAPPGAPAAAEDAAPSGSIVLDEESDCFAQLTFGRSEMIDCSFPALMSAEDRASIRRMTRELFKDARCTITVKLARRIIDEAMREPDSDVKLPPQSVDCEVETSKGVWPITFSFAPTVVFEAGAATKASPGMGDVKGVNSWLAWPVVEYVNRSGTIEEVMIRVINAYVKRYGPRASGG